MSTGESTETTNKNIPLFFDEVNKSKTRIIAYSLVLALCIFSHWYFKPDSQGCSLSFDYTSVSKTFEIGTNSWTYAPKTEDSQLALLRNADGDTNSNLQVAFDGLFRFLNTVINFIIGIWLLDCLPLLLGLHRLTDDKDTPSARETCMWIGSVLVVLKALSIFLVSACQRQTCTYILTSQ